MEHILAVSQKVEHSCHNPAVLLLGIYLRAENLCPHKSCPVQKWKQCQCPWTEELIKTKCHICKMNYYSAINEKWSTSTCYNMDEPQKHNSK